MQSQIQHIKTYPNVEGDVERSENAVGLFLRLSTSSDSRIQNAGDDFAVMILGQVLRQSRLDVTRVARQRGIDALVRSVDDPLESRRRIIILQSRHGTGSLDAADRTENLNVVDEVVEKPRFPTIEDRREDVERVMMDVDVLAAVMTAVFETGVEKAVVEDGSIVDADQPLGEVGAGTRVGADE